MGPGKAGAAVPETGTAAAAPDAADDAGSLEDGDTDEHAAPRLSQPAVEMVSDLQAAIGAFEIASPIQPLAADDGPEPDLDSWSESNIAEDRDVELDQIPTAPERTREPVAEASPLAADGPAVSDPETEEPEPAAVPPVAEIVADAVVDEEGSVAESVASAPAEEPPVPVRVEDPVATAREIAESGDRARAIAMLRTIVAEGPTNAPARKALITMLDAKGDSEGALQLADNGLERTPDDVSLLVARAALHAARARLEHAEIDLRRALRAEESNVEALTMLGLVCTRRGRWREAIEPLRKAAEIAPDSAAVHYYLGEALNRLDRLPEALSSYEMAAALEPENWRAHKGVGIVLDRLSRPQDAAEAYRRARETHRS